MTSFFEVERGSDPAIEVDGGRRPSSPELPFQAAGRWKTADAYAMRRIIPMKSAEGETIGYRPMIQQGRGQDRKTHSEVLRITGEVDRAMAMAMAQRWRDGKEAELGIGSGQISSKLAARFVPGISLVVSNKPPYRAFWKWSAVGKSTVTKYISKRLGFHESYRELVTRICEVLGINLPAELVPPMPTPSSTSPFDYLAFRICLTGAVRRERGPHPNRGSLSS